MYACYEITEEIVDNCAGHCTWHNACYEITEEIADNCAGHCTWHNVCYEITEEIPDNCAGHCTWHNVCDDKLYWVAVQHRRGHRRLPLVVQLVNVTIQYAVVQQPIQTNTYKYNQQSN